LCVENFFTQNKRIFIYFKMVKKINKAVLMIKELIRKGLRQCQISRLLGIKKEKVSYWSRHEIKELQSKPKK